MNRLVAAGAALFCTTGAMAQAVSSGDAPRAQAPVAESRPVDPADAATAALNTRVKQFNDGVAARNAAKAAAYQVALGEYNARVQSDSASYAQAQAAYRAQLSDLGARHEADLAAWRAKVKDCRHGDRSRCVGRNLSPAPPIPAHPLPPN